MIMGYSKNEKAARDFLRWVHSESVFAEWFATQQGYSDAATRMWENDKVWDADPVLLPFRDIPPLGRLAGYAGPPNRKAAEVVTKYIITDLYAKAIQGMPAEAAVKGPTTRSPRCTCEVTARSCTIAFVEQIVCL